MSPRSATAGDGCLNSLDRQQMVLFVLGLAQPGPAGGPTVLNQCPPPRPGIRSEESKRPAMAIIDPSIERSVRLVTTDGARGAADVTIGIDLDAAGDETKAMFTLNFDPGMLSIDGTSYPAASPDITLGADAPAGTTLAVNASEARTGPHHRPAKLQRPGPVRPQQTDCQPHVPHNGGRVFLGEAPHQIGGFASGTGVNFIPAIAASDKRRSHRNISARQNSTK